MSNKQDWDYVGGVYRQRPKKESLWDKVCGYISLAFILFVIVGALKSCS